MALPAPLAVELAPLRVVLEPLNAQIAAADERLAAVAATDALVERLRTAPGIGPVTAVAFVATLDVVTRFTSAHQVAAYLGLTPREYSSGERQHRGRISKTGSPRMRALLVEAAWRVLRSTQAAAAPLRAWAERTPYAAGAASPRSRWRDGWRAYCTRCGATGRTTAPPCRVRAPQRNRGPGSPSVTDTGGERVAAYGRW